ncbi:hypothetical protein BTO05_02575 [Winogradskyella sp. PC-19]|jgi:hypothetical protein|uniref:hypothetical protein n=1 Tax=unclassified Winogradskyella TaxID=2615021 RepID=UPI000B3D1110|nr:MULTISPECIES: hypothetical protein [unclassified Winogradskyella]ARV08578.1 hypothetical protein BTO05_02575 [Winogradskyella sp. PC-19]RZN75220.1 MAG: hypothetical protein EVB12_07485 [Winogradskyella sp.]
MNATDKQMLKIALRNGVLFTVILLLISYFKNGMINYNWIPIWFVFFAATGALRFYYQNKNAKKD